MEKRKRNQALHIKSHQKLIQTGINDLLKADADGAERLYYVQIMSSKYWRHCLRSKTWLNLLYSAVSPIY